MSGQAAYELKRGGVRAWLILAGLALRNWFADWIFFLPDFILNLVEMFTAAIIFYLMGRLVGQGAEPYIGEYGLSYGAYILTGVGLTGLMTTTLRTYHESFSNGYWSAVFDVYLEHPGGVSALLAGDTAARYCLSVVNTAIYLLVGVSFFGIAVEVSNLPVVIAILVLAVVSLTGLGLAGAGTFSLLNAKWGSNPVDLVVGFAVTLLAGVYFPPEVLPAWLQRLGAWLPQTHALHAARLVLSGQATLGDAAIRDNVVYLAQFAVVTLPIGLLLFGWGLSKAQREGTLTRWS